MADLRKPCRTCGQLTPKTRAHTPDPAVERLVEAVHAVLSRDPGHNLDLQDALAPFGESINLKGNDRLLIDRETPQEKVHDGS